MNFDRKLPPWAKWGLVVFVPLVLFPIVLFLIRWATLLTTTTGPEKITPVEPNTMRGGFFRAIYSPQTLSEPEKTKLAGLEPECRRYFESIYDFNIASLGGEISGDPNSLEFLAPVAFVDTIQTFSRSRSCKSLPNAEYIKEQIEGLEHFCSKARQKIPVESDWNQRRKLFLNCYVQFLELRSSLTRFVRGGTPVQEVSADGLSGLYYSFRDLSLIGPYRYSVEPETKPADFHAQKVEWEKRRKILERVLEISPKDEEALQLLVWEEFQRWAKRAELSSKAPDVPSSLISAIERMKDAVGPSEIYFEFRAKMAKEQGRYQEVVDLGQEALRMFPQSLSGKVLCAWGNSLLKRMDLAKQCLAIPEGVQPPRRLTWWPSDWSYRYRITSELVLHPERVTDASRVWDQVVFPIDQWPVGPGVKLPEEYSP